MVCQFRYLPSDEHHAEAWAKSFRGQRTPEEMRNALTGGRAQLAMARWIDDNVFKARGQAFRDCVERMWSMRDRFASIDFLCIDHKDKVNDPSYGTAADACNKLGIQVSVKSPDNVITTQTVTDEATQTCYFLGWTTGKEARNPNVGENKGNYIWVPALRARDAQSLFAFLCDVYE